MYWVKLPLRVISLADIAPIAAWETGIAELAAINYAYALAIWDLIFIICVYNYLYWARFWFRFWVYVFNAAY